LIGRRILHVYLRRYSSPGRMKRDVFFSLDDETSRKKTSLFSRPQKILHYPLVAKIFKSDTRFELAEFVRQLNGVNGYNCVFTCS